MQIEYGRLDAMINDDGYKEYVFNVETIAYIKDLISYYYANDSLDYDELQERIHATSGKLYRDVSAVVNLIQKKADDTTLDYYKDIVSEDFHKLQEYIWCLGDR